MGVLCAVARSGAKLGARKGLDFCRGHKSHTIFLSALPNVQIAGQRNFVLRPSKKIRGDSVRVDQQNVAAPTIGTKDRNIQSCVNEDATVGLAIGARADNSW